MEAVWNEKVIFSHERVPKTTNSAYYYTPSLRIPTRSGGGGIKVFMTTGKTSKKS
jgi:hypothetical protein